MTMPMTNPGRVHYVEALQQRSRDALDELHRGVDGLVLTDFPDHGNIGDSAIVLGQQAYWREAGIEIRATYSWRTIRDEVYDSAFPVAIHGGGNFGGLYPTHGEHRYALAERLRADTLLIQEPQSVYFRTDADRDEFTARMARRPNLRIGVRDTRSFAQLSGLVDAVSLAPDSVHMLGHLPAPAPTRSHLLLLRRDDETALVGRGDASVDWPEMTTVDLIRRRLSRALREGAITASSHRSTPRWFDDAHARLALGISLLAPGETIITDRLHAMLIGLQMGRRVIAIDNANAKLTSYAETWFDGLDAPLEFAADVSEALTRV